MKHKVHRLEVRASDMQEKLELFLNNLEGEVIAIIPNVTPLFLYFGSKVNFVLVIEKVTK